MSDPAKRNHLRCGESRSGFPLAAVKMVRGAVSGILQTMQPFKSNLIRQEQEALRALRADKDIVVPKVAKGIATVVLNRQCYYDKIRAILDSRALYKISWDPTEKIERKVTKLIKATDWPDIIKTEVTPKASVPPVLWPSKNK